MPGATVTPINRSWIDDPVKGRNQFSEIIAGLTPEERVVVEGSHVLKAELQRTAAGQAP